MKWNKYLQRSAPLLSDEQQAKVVQAIQRCEQKTSGEIRVYVESTCKWVDALDRAAEIFLSLKMDQTDNRNAVLVYIALQDHQYAIYGDGNIYVQAGGQAFWDTASVHLKNYFRQGLIAEGVCQCIEEIGDLMKLYYPFTASVDKNELPDEIVFGK